MKFEYNVKYFECHQLSVVFLSICDILSDA